MFWWSTVDIYKLSCFILNVILPLLLPDFVSYLLLLRIFLSAFNVESIDLLDCCKETERFIEFLHYSMWTDIHTYIPLGEKDLKRRSPLLGEGENKVYFLIK